ncbi:MAG: ABC transporter permease [Candidatus Heimdallarchaeota archaeon]
MTNDLDFEILKDFDLLPLLITILFVSFAILLLGLLKVRISQEALQAVSQSFIQLMILGTFLFFIFQEADLLLSVIILTFMSAFAGYTAGQRSPQEGATSLAFFAVVVTLLLILPALVWTRVFETKGNFLIPASAMIIGNTMNSTALALRRLHEAFQENWEMIESFLALGIDPQTTVSPYVRTGIETALIPTTNKLKASGVVHIPGLMTGLLIMGEDPIYAAELQFILLALIFVAGVFSAVIVSLLMSRKYFDVETARLKEIKLKS